MAARELLTYSRYRYGKRSYLYPGDRFRASGGPYYVGVDDHGNRVRIPMGEAGVFRFRQYCRRGASQWIEATRGDSGTAIIYVGRRRPSPLISGLRLRPHTIRPVYRRRRRRKASTPQPVQKTLFDVG
jgi:hypothetical protein